MSDGITFGPGGGAPDMTRPGTGEMKVVFWGATPVPIVEIGQLLADCRPIIAGCLDLSEFDESYIQPLLDRIDAVIGAGPPEEEPDG